MEEKEITYIPYGLDEISLLDLMTSLANGVDSYLNSRTWGKKAKYRDAWLRAYQDIMALGITGASNDTGIWRINHNGPNIDLSNKSNIEREMYGDAAYYILQQMSQMTPRTKKEEKKDESSKTKFDNAAFNSGLTTSIGSNLYGGMSSDKWNLLWANLDPEDRGIRGTAGRQKEMSNLLLKYLNKIELEKDKYSFEDTPYGSFDEWKNRATRAIAALNNPEWNDDDKNALNALGIDYNEWFNTGADKMVTVNMGDRTQRQMTQAEYNALEDKQNAEKVAAELKAALEKIALLKLNTYNNTLFLVPGTNPKMLGYNAQALKERYGASDKLVLALYNYSLQDIRSLTPDLLSEIHGAYRYLANQPIDSNLLKQILQSNRYKGAAPNRFKKINGIDNLIWDSVAGHVIQVQTRLQREALKNAPLDLFAGVKTLLDKENEYLNSKIPGITNAEWKELSAIGLDIASIINPEAITGSAMALGAAGLRHSAKNDSNPDWSFGDYFWQGVDYLTGALGGILVLGDAVLSAKTMATASRAIPILRKIARLGAWTDLYLSYPDLKEATRKITSGEELTVKDWRAIGLGIRGLVSHGRLNRGNRAERRVLEKSGQNVTPENISSMKGKIKNYSQKLGFTRTKPTNTSEVSTVKATVNGKESEIEISQNAKSRILEKVNKAGNSTEARNKAVKEVLESEGKVKASDKVEVEVPSTLRDGRFRPNWIGTSKNLFGTKSISSLLGNNVFNEYISGNRSYWDRYKYGSNRELKGIYNRFGLNNTTTTSKANESISHFAEGENDNIIKQIKNAYNPSTRKLTRESKQIKADSKLSGKLIDGSEYQVEYRGTKESNGKLSTKNAQMVVVVEGKEIPIQGSTLSQQKQNLGKWILEQNNKLKLDLGITLKSNDPKWKNFVKSILELKRKGFLYKQGGTINNNLDTIINDFFKNNNI